MIRIIRYDGLRRRDRPARSGPAGGSVPDVAPVRRVQNGRDSGPLILAGGKTAAGAPDGRLRAQIARHLAETCQTTGTCQITGTCQTN